MRCAYSDGYHTSQSMGGQSHSSFAAYNRHGNLVQGGHVSAADARHGELYTPVDQRYKDKW
ncbi:hypothetical protein K474DRAFT_1668104 [Panus rudis PR-1116 ss-1]|nr:hypothetical protein K474DRAFT_1668104 [Panus rudis PR-1116 ss-1]